jgi:hypothetical protein
MAALRADCNDAAVWSLGQLPILYGRFHQTNESRYGEQIRGLLQVLLQAFARSTRACPEAQQLAASLPDRLRLLHEEFGLPELGLKSPVAKPLPSRKPRPASPRSRKAY